MRVLSGGMDDVIDLGRYSGYSGLFCSSPLMGEARWGWRPLTPTLSHGGERE
jgi:hypothetical protein